MAERPENVKLAQRGAEEGWYSDRMEDLWPPVFAYIDILEARLALLEAVREAFLWQRETNIFIDQSVLYEAETQKAAMFDNAWAELMASEEESEAAIQNALAALEESDYE